MDELFSVLETKLKSLIYQYEQERETNQQLKDNQATIWREKELLLLKHKSAVAQIENMISRLKSLEKPV